MEEKGNTMYGIDLYDIFDGWIGLPGLDPSMRFDDLDEAIAKCKEKQCTLAAGNTGAHYGVIDLSKDLEIFCAREHNSGGREET